MLQAMSKLFRTYLVLWMLFALPLQGMAQASMFACHLKGSNPSSVVDSHLNDHADMNHTEMGHAMHGEVTTTPIKKQLAQSTHGCCNCAPSCAVVILPTTQISLDATRHEAVLSLVSVTASFSADSRRIDRPPKTTAI